MNLFFEHENFFHPCVIPFRGKLILLMSKITAMDRFTPPYFCFSEDGGKSWSKPEQIPTLKAFEKCADFRPIKLPDDNRIMIIGLVTNGADKEAVYSGYKTVYLSFDGEWSEPKALLGKEENNHRVACAQTALAADGSIIIPIYFDSPEKGGFKRGAYFTADIAEGAARLVGDFVLADDGGGDFFLEVFIGNQSAEIGVEGGFHRRAPRLPLPDRADDSQRVGDFEQLARREAAACLRAAEVARAVDRAAEGGSAEAAAQRHRVVGLLQQVLYLMKVGLRLKGERPLARVGQRGLRRQSFQYFIKFQCFVMSVHGQQIAL